MIKIIKAPKTAAVFLSENPIDIEVKSTLGKAYYFKVFIYVDDKFFDEQGWSKYNDFNVKIALKGMFNNLFTYPFPTLNGDVYKPTNHLLKKINITIKEYKRDDDSLVNTLNLNPFYVLKSEKAMFFDERINFQKMSILPNVLRLSKGKAPVVRFPIWVCSKSFSLKVVSGGALLKDLSFNDFTKNILEVVVNLTKETIYGNEVRVILSDFKGNNFTQQFIFIDELAYEVSKMYFRNNYGVYEYIEFFGSLKESNTYKRKTYNLLNDVTFLANTAISNTLKINTGYLLPNEIPILEAINLSKEVFVSHNDMLLQALPISKKSKGLDFEKNYLDDFIELKINGSLPKSTSFKYD